MSITHHPPDTMLAAFAAGTVDHGQHVAVATHLVACPQCRSFVRSIERVGGEMLTALAPAAMAHGAFAAVEARLDEPVRAHPAAAPLPAQAPEVPGLPKFVRGYRFDRWIWVAPSVSLRRVALPYSSDTRVFLLKSGPGTRMLQHTHTGIEMTCVLAGAFRQDGNRFGPGDFDLGDDTIEHRPIVEPGDDCLCLVAMQGELRLSGLIGRLVQPFLRV